MLNIFKQKLNKFISKSGFKVDLVDWDLSKNMDKNVKKIIYGGIKFSFVLLLFSVLIMSLYISQSHTYIAYDIGTGLFRASSMFIAIFFIYGIVFNKILQDRKQFKK